MSLRPGLPQSFWLCMKRSKVASVKRNQITPAR